MLLRKWISLIAGGWLAGTVCATDYYVATNGLNSSDGLSPGAPFASVQHAADVAASGDTVYIRGGTYREEVSLPRSGTAGAPIVFQAYNDEQVDLVTTEPLTGWTLHSGSIYKASLDSSVVGRDRMTIFVDGAWINEAHWTDQGAKADLLERSTFATYDDASHTQFTDADLIGFPDDYWDGAFVWVQSANWRLDAFRVADFDGGSGTITLDGEMFYDPTEGYEYLIFDTLKALDAPGEWYFDEAANELYVWVAGDDSPDNHTVEVKQRAECFVLNGHDHIQIVGIDMLGGDLDMAGSDYILVRGSKISVPDRHFGPEGSGDATGLVLSGDHNTVRDCEIKHTWGSAIAIYGEHNQLINNWFHDNSYLNGSCVSMQKCGDGCLVSHNTFDRIGRGAIGGTGYHFVIQHNEFSRTAILTEDVGALSYGNTSYNNSIIHHNVFHNIDALYSTGIYVDNMGTDVLFHHNISYNIDSRGMQFNLPAAFLFVYNNTTYDSGQVAAWSPTPNVEAFGTRIANNIYASLSSGLITGGATVTGNYVSASSAEYMDAANGDFRLVDASGAVDAGVEIPGVTDGFAGDAPDAGALEYGEPMFAFGHDFSNPPNPIYEWKPVPFMNLADNPGLENSSLDPWLPIAGTPAKIDGNAWNYKDDALGTAGTGALELEAGDKVAQVVGSLTTNTLYEFSIMGRQVRDIQVEAYDAKNGTFTSGNYRSETWLGDLDAGEWLCYSNINFGSARFNRIELGKRWDNQTGGVIDVRLDAPDGPLLASLDMSGFDGRWYMSAADIPAASGTRDLYLVIGPGAGPDAIIDRIRFMGDVAGEEIRFSAGYFDAGDSNAVGSCTNALWGSDPDKVRFRTGTNHTEVTLSIEKVGGVFNGYVDQIVLMEVETEAVVIPSVDTTIKIVSGGIGNGDLQLNDPFEAYQGSTPLAITSNSNGRRLISNSAIGTYVTFPGWRGTRTRSVGGNPAWGIDGAGRGAISGAPNTYFFVNSGDIELVSDTHTVSLFPGHIATISFELISQLSSVPAASCAGQVDFGNGQIFSWTAAETSVAAADTLLRFSKSFELTQRATEATITLNLSTGVSGNQTLIDNIKLIADTPPPITLMSPTVNDGSFESFSEPRPAGSGYFKIGTGNASWTLVGADTTYKGILETHNPMIFSETTGNQNTDKGVGAYTDVNHSVIVKTASSLAGTGGYGTTIPAGEGDVLSWSFDLNHHNSIGSAPFAANLSLTLDFGAYAVDGGLYVTRAGGGPLGWRTESGSHTLSKADAAALNAGAFGLELLLDGIDTAVYADNFQMEVERFIGINYPVVYGFRSEGGGVFRVVMDTAGSDELVLKSTTNLVDGIWERVPHSTDGAEPFAVTNIGYATSTESNRVIYVQSPDEQRYYKLDLD